MGLQWNVLVPPSHHYPLFWILELSQPWSLLALSWVFVYSVFSFIWEFWSRTLCSVSIRSLLSGLPGSLLISPLHGFPFAAHLSHVSWCLCQYIQNQAWYFWNFSTKNLFIFFLSSFSTCWIICAFLIVWLWQQLQDIYQRSLKIFLFVYWKVLVQGLSILGGVIFCVVSLGVWNFLIDQNTTCLRVVGEIFEMNFSFP